MGGVLTGFPVVGEESLEPFGGMGVDALEDVSDVGEGIHLHSLACADEAGEDRRGSPTFIAAEEEPPWPRPNGEAGMGPAGRLGCPLTYGRQTRRKRSHDFDGITGWTG